MTYKLIAFDMDGTLLNSKKEVSAECLKAISKAVSVGKYVALSTGRNPKEIEAYLDILKDVRYTIAASGALIFDNLTKERLYQHPLEDSVIKELFKRVSKFDLMLHMHSDTSYVQTNQECNMAKYHMGQYQSMFDRICVKTEDLPTYYNKKPFPVYKFNCYCQGKKMQQEVKDCVCDLPITWSYAETTSVECSAPNTSKGTGLEKLCKILGISVSESIAVGDAENDISVIKTAGLGIAMANSNPALFEIAGATVADCDHDGCAEAIYKYLLS